MSRKRLRKTEATGPFAPPTPSEVDQEGPEPMAVARDKTTPFDAAVPTTASHDAYAGDAAAMPRSNEETRKAERPPGYGRVDEHGFRHLVDEDGEE